MPWNQVCQSSAGRHFACSLDFTSIVGQDIIWGCAGRVCVYRSCIHCCWSAAWHNCTELADCNHTLSTIDDIALASTRLIWRAASLVTLAQQVNDYAGAQFNPSATTPVPPDPFGDLECSEQILPDALLQDALFGLSTDSFVSPSKPKQGRQHLSDMLQEFPVPLGHSFPNQKCPQGSPQPKQAALPMLSPNQALSPFQTQQQAAFPHCFSPQTQRQAQTQLRLPQPQTQTHGHEMLVERQYQPAPSAQLAPSQELLPPIAKSSMSGDSCDFGDFMMGFLNESAGLLSPGALPQVRQASMHNPASQRSAPHSAYLSGPQGSAPQHSASWAAQLSAAQPSYAHHSLATESATQRVEAVAAQAPPHSSSLLNMAMDLANHHTAGQAPRPAGQAPKPAGQAPIPAGQAPRPAGQAPTPAAHTMLLQLPVSKVQQPAQLAGNAAVVARTSPAAQPTASGTASLSISKSAGSSQQGPDSSAMQLSSVGTQQQQSSSGSFCKQASSSQLSDGEFQLSSRANLRQAAVKAPRQARAKRPPKRLAEDASEAATPLPGAGKEASAKQAKRAVPKVPAPKFLAQLQPFDRSVVSCCPLQGILHTNFFPSCSDRAAINCNQSRCCARLMVNASVCSHCLMAMQQGEDNHCLREHC